MKSAHQIAAKAITSVKSESTRNCSKERARLSEKWIRALFAKFSVIWPSAWANVVDKVDLPALEAEWSIGLHGLSGEQIGAAIDHCRTHHTWPPTIAEFRSAATGSVNAEQAAFHARLKAEDDGIKRLPRQSWFQMREEGKAQLAALRQQLRKTA
jgi:hypothetical protein